MEWGEWLKTRAIYPLPWKEWENLHWVYWREQAERRGMTVSRQRFEDKHPVKTGRDNYGWRGVRDGSRMLGGPLPRR